MPTAPTVAMPAHELWRDQAFNYDPAAVSVRREDLFALDTELMTMLDASGMKSANTQARANYLLTLLFGPERKPFPYLSGQSTVSAVTWRSGRGDCLSLSVLAYSIAKALNLPAQLQEVRITQFFDRHGGVDFIEGHINLLIKNASASYQLGSVQAGSTIAPGNVLIDFEPQTGWMRPGTALSEENVLARYYSNIAADYFAGGNLVLAYAWFKAAILADPGNSSSYSNLAQLYKRKGFVDSAERLLLHAIALNGNDTTAVRSMHKLLVAQGRDTEAEKYARILQAEQQKDPYYWLGVGMNYLREAKYGKAVRALEHAESLTSGFDEVHRNLAIAYWYQGDKTNAQKQLDLLASLISPEKTDAGFTALSRKIGKM